MPRLHVPFVSPDRRKDSSNAKRVEHESESKAEAKHEWPSDQHETPLPEYRSYNHAEIPSKPRIVCTRRLRNAFTESLVIPSPQTGDLDHTFIPTQNTGS
ncbi:hypothetical protein PDIG_50740 [Penicillium digitatum PHI26]|uniref:Uncharacterized protein n=2 Tax=Penicillium digitatum TaxID=36651 RepID=K9FSE0_PEND2|nr:hypothetical protein PDIP_19960 [Penicillium digitatum Pd1]EKV11357.1 hypothetical protein PDIG_50740 [Penicillium digitatum PHI26]EKV20061.1 hypothetical protein PDIP_19960 [Penicillium digitatum Pd1]